MTITYTPIGGMTEVPNNGRFQMPAVGITGHRVLTEVDRIEVGIDRAIRRIERAFPGERMTLLSPLAEGADRLVARRLLARPGMRLVAPLPLPPDDFATDFATNASRHEFRSLLRCADQVIALPPQAERDDAYEAAGRYVLDNCTVLIAVWDGGAAQGRAGTGQIVAEARQRRLPIAWVRAGNRVPGTMEPTSLGSAQGKVTFENFPDQRGGPHKRLRRWVNRGHAAWRRIVHPLLSGLRWPFLIAGSIATFILGLIGFSVYWDGSRSAPDVVYASLQLFLLESGLQEPPLNPALQAARFGGAAVAAVAIVQALVAIFGVQIQAARLRFFRRHVIICGLGRRGWLLARSFADQGHPVVVVDQDGAIGEYPACRERGIIPLVGNATSRQTLRRAGVGRAARVISVCGDDGANVEVAALAAELNPSRSIGNPLLCTVHVTEPRLWHLLREQEIRRGAEGVRAEFISIFDTGARAWLERTDPFAAMQDRRPHLVIVGVGLLGERLAVRAAMAWRARGQDQVGRLRLTLLDRAAAAKRAALLARFPFLTGIAAIEARDIDVHSAQFHRGDFLRGHRDACDVDAIYVCLGSDDQALYTASSIFRHARSLGVPVHVRTERETGMASLLGNAGERTDGLLRPFGLLDETCVPGRLFADTWETLAREIHEDYVGYQRRTVEDPDQNPSVLPWAQLPEDLREANRFAVSHIGEKLARIDCFLAVSADLNAPPIKLRERRKAGEDWAAAVGDEALVEESNDSDEVEELARLEHERWCREMEASGWKRGGKKDWRKKTNPNLVAWDQLDRTVKNYNRHVVRMTPTFLKGAGFDVQRRS